MIMSEAAAAAPLDDQMLVTDVVDTLRRGVDLPFDPRSAAAQPGLIGQLHEVYRRQGIDISDNVLRDGIAAMAENRFVYAPPRGPFARLARLYVARRNWGRPALVAIVLLVLALAGYLVGYRPYAAAQAERAQLELQQQIPGELDALYQEVFDDTKVQTAADDAGELRDRGKAAAARDDRTAADAALTELTDLRDTLEAAYTVRVVDDDSKPGFWTFPTNNAEATNYYIVVEAVDDSGKILTLPITSDDTGTTTRVSRWGLRVPESVYDAVLADKQDDGIIQHGIVGIKQDGFIDVDYAVPVLGGTLTQW